ncbi:MAG: hypothetical protein U1F76_09450 [Candidatus Competibacteraceae bacterium]
MSARQARYPGARPFQDTLTDRRLFFGRAWEIETLCRQVLANRLVVLFGRDGIGKTSLLQAGLFPRLQEQALLPLAVGMPVPFQPKTLIAAVDAACQSAGIDSTPEEHTGLKTFFKTTVFTRGGITQTPVLVLDRFETCCIPAAEGARQWLAGELSALLKAESPPLKIVLSVQEDFLGFVQTLPLPGILDNCLRLTALEREQARLAIVEPGGLTEEGLLTQPFTYAAEAVKEMLDFLAGKNGGTIDPLPLQILCHRLERRIAQEQAKGRQYNRIDSRSLGGRAGMMGLLRQFYRDTVQSLPRWRLRRQTRALCERGLVDAIGHPIGLEETFIGRRYKVGAPTLQALTDAGLLHRQSRAEGVYYTLSHPLLAQSVRANRRLPEGLKAGLGLLLLLAGLGFGAWQWQRHQAAEHARELKAYATQLEQVRAEAEQKKQLSATTVEQGTKAWIEAEGLLSDLLYDLHDKLEPIGRLDVLRYTYPRINTYLEQVPDLQLAGVEIQRAGIYLNQGDFWRSQNNLDNAWQSYQLALKLAEQAVQQTPDNAEWQRLLALVHDRTGEILQARNDFNGALGAYQTSLQIREKLTRRDPKNADWQRDLFVSHNKLGEAMLANGNPGGAFNAFQNARKIIEKLAQQDADNADWQHDLAFAHNRIAELLQARGDTNDALAAYQNSRRILEKLTEKDPNNTGWQRDLFIIQAKIGELSQARGDLNSALAAYQASRKLMEQLAKRDPNNTDWQRDLFTSQNRIGNVLLARGDANGALGAYQSGRRIMEQLLKNDPNNIDWQRNLIASHNQSGEALQAKGDINNALAAFQSGRRLVEKLNQRDPNNTEWQGLLAVSYNKIGEMSQAKGDLDGALASFQTGRQLLDKLIPREPGNLAWQYHWSNSQQKIGEVLQAEGDLQGALDAFQKSRETMERLSQRAPNDTAWQRDLFLSQTKVGEVLRARGDRNGAANAFQDSLKTAEALALHNPDNATWQIDWVVAAYNLAEATDTSTDGGKIAAKLNYGQALTTLRQLESRGQLPADRKDWIGAIEARLKALGE